MNPDLRRKARMRALFGKYFVAPIIFMIAGLIAACGGPKPCVDCPNVAGAYTVILHGTELSESSCGAIAWYDERAEINLEQEVSRIRIREWNKEGTLFEDWSVAFPPFADTTVKGDTGETEITGSFSTDLSAYRGDWSFTFVRDMDNCKAVAPVDLLPR